MEHFLPDHAVHHGRFRLALNAHSDTFPSVFMSAYHHLQEKATGVLRFS